MAVQVIQAIYDDLVGAQFACQRNANDAADRRDADEAERIDQQARADSLTLVIADLEVV